MVRRVVVTGTATEIGKTWASVRMIEVLRERGQRVVARKPAQSYEEGEEPTDADLLAAATGESPYAVCRPERWYPLPVAPPMAAEALGRPPIALGDLIGELDLPDGGVVLIEGVGGPRSPLADDGDTVELARAAADLVILVAEAALGAINAVTLAAEALAEQELMVFLNRYDDAHSLHRWNRRWLEEVAGLDVAVAIEDLADRVTALPDQEVG